ncbi:hypothetical protein [Acidovorax sp.]|uniref:hypothetical protein n=1 Tax=Acidovorax sp. TaxID=1872122 RepID=UPI003CFDE67F
MKNPLLAAALFLPLVLSGCDDAHSARIEETRGRMVGTWLREAEFEGAKLRLVIALGQDGKFTERSKVVAPNGSTESEHYGGEWSYDGTNFKRRYLQQGGRQFSGGGIRYATYQLTSLSCTDFTGRDNREDREITYRRVSEGTEP